MIVDTDPLKNIPGLVFFLSVDKVELIPAGGDFACYCSFQMLPKGTIFLRKKNNHINEGFHACAPRLSQKSRYAIMKHNEYTSIMKHK